MDAFTFTKRDFVCLLGVCTLFPLASFIAGFSIAGSSESAEPTPIYWQANLPEKQSCPPGLQEKSPSDNQQLGMQESTESDLSPQEAVDNASQAEPEVVSVPEVQYLVQAGIFSKASNADKFVDSLAHRGINAEIIDTESEGTHYFRVVVGAFGSQERAEAQLARFQSQHSIELYVARQSVQPDYLAGL